MWSSIKSVAKIWYIIRWDPQIWFGLMFFRVYIILCFILGLFVFYFGKIPFGKHPGQSLTKAESLYFIPIMFGIVLIIFFLLILYKIITVVFIIKNSAFLKARIVDFGYMNGNWLCIAVKFNFNGIETLSRFCFHYMAYKEKILKGAEINIMINKENRGKVFPLEIVGISEDFFKE